MSAHLEGLIPGAPTLEEFAVDRQLGNFPEASPAQRLVMRLIDGLPPADAKQRELFEALVGCAWSPEFAGKRISVALVMGADSGKSLISALAAVHRAVFADLTSLRRGQRGVSLVVAPTTRLAAIVLGYATGIVQAAPMLREELEVEPTTERMVFERGTELAVMPASAGGAATRGRRFVLAILEESAFFRDSSYRVNDVEIIRAVRPRLLPGAQLLSISTPYRKTGALWEAYRDHHGHASSSTLVLNAPTRIMRPDKAAESIDREYDEDAESARAEFGAEFLDNAQGFVDECLIDDAISPGVTRRPRPESGGEFVAAMDPSGLRNDAWAFTILGRVRGVVEQFVSIAWLPGTSVKRIVEGVRHELELFGLSRVFSDQYGSEVTAAHFTNAGLIVEERPFSAGSNSAKHRGFKSLKALLQAGAIRLLDDSDQTRELKLLEVTRLSGGGERIAAPGRMHDDRACALALAVSEIHTGTSHSALLDHMREMAGRTREEKPGKELSVDERRERAERRRAWEKSIVNRESLHGDLARIGDNVEGV